MSCLRLFTTDLSRKPLVAQLVENLLALQKIWFRSLGWEDPLEKERLPTSVFWPGEFHELCSHWGHKELDTTERLSLSLSLRLLVTLQKYLSSPK